MAEQTLKTKLHIASTIIVIMAGMMVLDAYLVEQNTGSRRTGVLVMLLIGDVCLLFVLRYVGVWVGGEVSSTKRGCSMAEWFLVIFVVDIKMYFVLENVRKECFTEVEIAMEASNSEEEEDSVSIFQPEITFTGKEKLSTEDLMLAYAQIGVRSAYDGILTKCDYAMSTKKILSLFHAIFIPGFYILLVGADYQENIGSLRELDEVKMRAFWVIVDLLDLLDLQSSMWESQQGALPYLTVGFIYFYCYIVLIVLPPLSLAEMSKRNETRPHEMVIYLMASFVTVNVATTAIRFVLLFSNDFGGVSAIFIGKNVVCIFFKATKLAQINLVKRRKIRFLRDDGPPFTLNDLRKDDRNHVGFSTQVVIEPIGKASTVNVRKNSENGDGSPAMKFPDKKCPEFQHNHTGWSYSAKGVENLKLHLDKNEVKECDALMSKQGSYSSSTTTTTASQRAAEGNYDQGKQQEAAPWHRSYLEALGREEEEVDSLDEILNNNLSPNTSSDEKFCRKLTRSYSATLDTSSDGGNEKRVRFQKEKLSPVASEGQSMVCDPLLTELREGSAETTSPVMPSLASSESSAHPFSSAENSTSTTDCGTQLDSIKEWNSQVIDQIATLRNNLNEAFGNKEAREENHGMMTNGIGETSFDISDIKDSDLGEEEEIKFPSRIPSPLPESLPDTCRRCASAMATNIPTFGSIRSLSSDLVRPMVPSTSAGILSASTTTVPSSVAASSMIVSPSIDLNFNHGLEDAGDDDVIRNDHAIVFNGLESPSLSKMSEDEDYVRPQSMCLLDDISPKKKHFRNYTPRGCAEGSLPRRIVVNRASQTNLLDESNNNATL